MSEGLRLRPPGFQLGRLFGTDIYASGGFLLLLGVILLLQKDPAVGALLGVALLVSLLVHEFGHVFAVRWTMKAPSVVLLWGLGGLCFHPATPHRGKRIAISLMGPAFQLALFGLLLLAKKTLPSPAPLLAILLEHMLWINLYWPLLNLAPILPLDGGQAMAAALEARLPAPRAIRATARLGVFVAAGGMAAGFFLDEVVLMFLAAWLLIRNLPLAQARI
ncbi:MAG: hypothetical protein ACT4PV_07670 [Planctomycetaceae bacterium]